MPQLVSRQSAGSAVTAGRARTLAQVYRHFGEVEAAETSPLYERVAVALSESDEALRAIEAAPARKRHPTVILAALHDLALAGRAPALAAAYATADGDAAAVAAIDTLLRMTGSVVAIAVRRQTRTNQTGQATRHLPCSCRLRSWETGPSPRGRCPRSSALAATAPPLLLQGDAVKVMPDAFARVPADALPVVTTTWALSHFPLESRLRFLHRLDEAATGRTVAWVSQGRFLAWLTDR
jgi:hypothetical protein